MPLCVKHKYCTDRDHKCHSTDHNKNKCFAIRIEDDDLNRGHFHEIIDRCHVILSNIDDHLIGHPGMTKAMIKKCEQAQELLYSVMNNSYSEESRLFGEDK